MAKNTREHFKLSKQCANYWWKLKAADRKEHNKMIKIQLMSPFLFLTVYQSETWIKWAEEAGLLTRERIGTINELSEEEMINSDLVEKALSKLQTEIMEHKEPNYRITQVLEDIMDSVEECLELGLSELLSSCANKSWYTAVRNKVVESDIPKSGNATIKYDCAVFLAAWQVHHYLKSISKGEQPLELYKKDLQLDEITEKKKTSGNEFYKNREYGKAIEEYTSILVDNPYICILYSNRAACYIRKKEYRSALSDGRRIVTLNPHWEKGHYWYAQALLKLGCKETAIKILKEAIEICDTTSDIRKLLNELEPQNDSIERPMLLLTQEQMECILSSRSRFVISLPRRIRRSKK